VGTEHGSKVGEGKKKGGQRMYRRKDENLHFVGGGGFGEKTKGGENGGKKEERGLFKGDRGSQYFGNKRGQGLGKPALRMAGLQGEGGNWWL